MKIFKDYPQTYTGNVTTLAPSRLVKPDVKQESTKYNNSYQQSPVDQFKKAIKRNKSDFTVLKDKKQFKSWNHNLVSLASAQDVEEVLDPTYKPYNEKETKLFTEKQKYMYLVAMTMLKTDRGTIFLGKHEDDRDAQKVFEKFINFYLHSRTSDIDSSSSIKYITSEKLGEGTWNVTTVVFISHWQEQVSKYDNISNEVDVIGPTLMHIMLKKLYLMYRS